MAAPESAGHSAGTYICYACKTPLHLYASASGAQDRDALAALDWRYEKGGWRCSDCSASGTQQEGDR